MEVDLNIYRLIIFIKN